MSTLNPSATRERPAFSSGRNNPSVTAKPLVIALHCSGASGRQWRHLANALGSRFELIAPDFFGCGTRGHWSGERPFALTDEAARIVKFIDASAAPVHLVGHSYGGGVALRAAVERPMQIASLSLYEPTAFNVLKVMGPDGRIYLDEIRTIARDVQQAVLTGNIAMARAASSTTGMVKAVGPHCSRRTRKSS